MDPRAAFRFLCLCVVGLACQAAHAEDKLSPAARDALVQKLYAPLERPADFEDAAGLAIQEGLPAQTVAEARLAFCLRTRTLDERLTRTVGDLETLRGAIRWQKDDSRLFDDPDELEGTLFFARALLAEKGGDEGEFARCLKEAFWYNPSAGDLFGRTVREHRRTAALAANLSLPPDQVLRDSAGRTVAAKDFLRDHRAVLLEFWASWCDPSVKRMDELENRARILSESNVVVAGVNVEDDPSLAEQFRRTGKVTFPWLVDGAGKGLCHALRVQTIPHAVLLGPDGRVLFSGHPDDAGLRDAVQALGVAWKD